MASPHMHANKYDNDEDDDWGEGEALAAEGTDILSDGAYRHPPAASASAAASAANGDSILKDGHSPTQQSRAERLQAKIEREAALRSGRGSEWASGASGASTTQQGAATRRANTTGASARSATPLEAPLLESSSSSSQQRRGPTTGLSSSSSPEAPEDRLAAKIRREAAASSSTSAAGSAATRTTLTARSHESNEGGSASASATTVETTTSDLIQARLRQEQRRAQASYSAGSGQRSPSAFVGSSASAAGGSTSGGVPGVTIHGPTRANGSGKGGGGGGGGGEGGSTVADRASAKASTKGAASASSATPDDRLRSKVVARSGLGSLREDRPVTESTPDDRLQSKLRQASSSSAPFSAEEEESTPDDRLQSKLLRGGESSVVPSRMHASSSSAVAEDTPDDRLVAKIQRDSTGAGGTPGRNGHGNGEEVDKGSRCGAAAAAAVAGTAAATVGAVAVRGARADEYDAGIRRSRYSEDWSDGSSSAPPEDDGFVREGGPSEPSVPFGEAQDGVKKDEARFCGMSKRMAIVVVGAALLVVIVAAAAGGAAAGNSSSSGGSTPAPEEIPPPLEDPMPTISPTLAPTKFVPPECQLTMLSKGEGIGDFQESDHFGSSVAVSGDTAIVGAPLSSKGGSVHLYVRDDDYTWVKSPIVLQAPEPIENGLFGRALDVDGSTLVVGDVVPYATTEVGEEGYIGCVYVFVRGPDGNWVEEARLLADDPDMSDASFGSAVALNDNTLVVGEPKGESLPLVERTGSVYIFERLAGEGWVQTAKLRPEDGNIGDNFGSSVDVSGPTVVVGAVRNDASGKDSGVAYAYSKVDMTWALKNKLIPADGSAFDSFGRSVAISADVIVVGARGDDDNGLSSGSTYVFVDNNGQWVEAAKLLAEDGKASDGFGKAVDVDGDFIVVGAEGADDDRDFTLENVGAAYVFERVGFSVWTQISHLQPAGGDKDDAFGSSVASNDGTVLVGSFTSKFGQIETGNAHIIEMC